MGDQREVRSAAGGGTARTAPRDEHQAGLMSAAGIARMREGPAHEDKPARRDVVALVTNVTVVPDHGDGARIYVTLDAGYQNGPIPGRFGQLRIAGGALIPGARFEIVSVSDKESRAVIDLEGGAGADLMGKLAKGTLEAVIFADR